MDDVQRVELRRTPCHGQCPVYQVVLEASGRATYRGEGFVERLGTFEGRFNPREFEHLVAFLGEIAFDSLEEDYPAPMTDMPSAIITVSGPGGSRRVRNEGSSGPAVLWGAAYAIDGLVARITWERAAG